MSFTPNRKKIIFLFLFSALIQLHHEIITLNMLEGDVLVVFSPSSCQAEWEKVFSDVSLSLVAVRKSFCGSALFLCRSRPVVKQPIFLPVDSPDYNWVETLKVGSFFSSSGDTSYRVLKCIITCILKPSLNPGIVTSIFIFK